jgi:hypothetical protein
MGFTFHVPENFRPMVGGGKNMHRYGCLRTFKYTLIALSHCDSWVYVWKINLLCSSIVLYFIIETKTGWQTLKIANHSIIKSNIMKLIKNSLYIHFNSYLISFSYNRNSKRILKVSFFYSLYIFNEDEGLKIERL